MDEMALLEKYLFVGALLFGIGLVGFTARRNMIVMFLSAEMMLQGVSVSLVAWSRYHDDWGGQMLVIFILPVVVWQQLREDDQPPYVERRLPPPAEEPSWPTLTPAGIEPEPDLEEITHRAKV